MPYRIHELMIDPEGRLAPYLVVHVAGAEAADRDEAIMAAVEIAAEAGLRTAATQRVARTPSGGWTVSLALT